MKTIKLCNYNCTEDTTVLYHRIIEKVMLTYFDIVKAKIDFEYRYMSDTTWNFVEILTIEVNDKLASEVFDYIKKIINKNQDRVHPEVYVL